MLVRPHDAWAALVPVTLAARQVPSWMMPAGQEVPHRLGVLLSPVPVSFLLRCNPSGEESGGGTASLHVTVRMKARRDGGRLPARRHPSRADLVYPRLPTDSP